MNSKRIIYIGAVIAIVAVTGFFLWQKADKEETFGEADADFIEEEASMEPQPVEQLLFVKKTGGEFTPEQQESIEEFKAKILVRAGLGVELTEQEKEILNVVISDQEALMPNGDIVVNQSVLKFSAEELNLVSNALRK